MNAVVKPVDGKEKSFPVLVNQGVVEGRLGSRRSFQLKEGKRFFQLLTIPGADRYAMPSIVELKSIAALGGDGDEWSGVVRIGGYPYTRETTDMDGVVSKIYGANNVLEVVEG